jgi:hypothetical protein
LVDLPTYPLCSLPMFRDAYEVGFLSQYRRRQPAAEGAWRRAPAATSPFRVLGICTC